MSTLTLATGRPSGRDGLSTGPLGLAAGLLRRYFLPLLLGGYVLAGLAPAPGVWLGGLSAGEVALGGSAYRLTPPMLLLATILALAGLEVPLAGLGRLARRPGSLLAGLAGNLLVPVVFIAAVAQLARLWHGGEGVQPVLVGLGLIAAMPIAGSATAWAQKADGDAGLSLGLVLASTALSFATTPLTLYAVSAVAPGDQTAVLRDLAGHGTGLFLLLCVLLPSVLGIVGRQLLGAGRVEAARPIVKVLSSAALLTMVYVNASRTLPGALARPDPDLLAALGLVAGSFCATAFAAGWLVGKLLGVPAPEQASLLFALGMSNNGTGMVLASATLADRPEVGLVVVCYGLIQHLAAGGVDWARSNLALPARPGVQEGAGWRESAPVRALASFGFVLVAAVVAANAAASYWNVRTLAEGNKLVVHTHEVITRLQGVLSLLKDAETGQRGYLLTGRDEYLAPYRVAVARVPGEVDRLAELTADNPEQQARLPALRARVAEKLGELREAVEAERGRGHDAALAVVLSDRGKRVMDDIRAAVGELEATELAALEARAAAADARVRRTLTSIIATTLLVLAVQLARGLLRLRRRPEGTA